MTAGLSNCGARPCAFSDRGCLLFSVKSLTSCLPGRDCLGNVTNVELLSTLCSQRRFYQTSPSYLVVTYVPLFINIAFKHKKTVKIDISTSIWSAQHPDAGQNIQHA